MHRESTKSLLQSIPIFQDLTDYEIEPILDLAVRRVFPNRTHVFMQGEDIKNVYFILQGKVKIYRTDVNGKEQIVNILQAGEMFPHQGFFRKDGYPAHAKTAKDSTLIYIPIKSFEEFLITHPEISIKLFRVLGNLIVDLQQRLEEQILYNTYEQIIMLLLRLANQYGEELDEDKIKIVAKFTNRELANMIGSSRETVSRTLSILRNQNGIMAHEDGYLIIDRDRLEEELF